MFNLLLDKQLDKETLLEFVSSIIEIDKSKLVLIERDKMSPDMQEDEYYIDYFYFPQGDAKVDIDVMVRDDESSYIEQIKQACIKFNINCYWFLDEGTCRCITSAGEDRFVQGIEEDYDDDVTICYFKEFPDESKLVTDSFDLLLDKQPDKKTLLKFLSAITQIDENKLVLLEEDEFLSDMQDDEELVHYYYYSCSEGDLKDFRLGVEVYVGVDDYSAHVERIKQACCKYNITCYWNIDVGVCRCIQSTGKEKLVIMCSDQGLISFEDLPESKNRYGYRLH